MTTTIDRSLIKDRQAEKSTMGYISHISDMESTSMRVGQSTYARSMKTYLETKKRILYNQVMKIEH